MNGYPRPTLTSLISLLWGLSAAGALAPASVAAQLPAGQVAGGDFDICDFCGGVVGNTIHLRGRSGFGTGQVSFVLINAANDAQDVDRDGYTPGVDFTNLFVSNVTNFVNVRDPSQVILGTNLVVADFLNPLRNGFQNSVNIAVNIPNATPAGIYRGSMQIRDSVLVPNAVNPNGEQLRIDVVNIEIEVLATPGLGLVQADTAAELDSLVLRGRPGQTVSGVFRVANLGNVPLANVRVEATDLIATSGTGLRIRREQITFSPTALTSVGFGDTARVTVTVRIPLGILAGSYRGDLIVQGDEIGEVRVPLTVIVTTPGEIVFENNPVRGRQDDNAVIIFNADPGSTYQIAIFDMMAITTFRASGVVFAGSNGGGVGEFPGDQAVRYAWNLRNGRGEQVAGGMYYVIVDAQQDGQRRQLRGKLMVIR